MTGNTDLCVLFPRLKICSEVSEQLLEFLFIIEYESMKQYNTFDIRNK